jgi:glycine/sarcosine N-methyltransferase
MVQAKLMKKEKQQDYGNEPEKIRNSEFYKEEYVHGFVDKWDELIDWNARAKGEGSFFIEELRKRGKKRILDVATGTGFHSVQLLKNGFEVWSVDGSPNMLAKAFENGKQNGHILKTIQSDWRWLNKDLHNKFDAIICLGNSFTHLFDENDRRKALAEFYSALKHDGILILDQRNYDTILDNGFKSKHTFYYAGNNVKAEPEYWDDGLIRFKYEFPDKSVYNLNMFPLRKEYTRNLLCEVGFQKVETFGDFEETYQTKDPDFFIHIADKKYQNMK